MVLGAGAGLRLHPLTLHHSKVLCPLGDRTLLDHALDRVRTVTSSVAANVRVDQDDLLGDLRARADVHVSVEPVEALGTAGAIGHLADWIDGRGVVVVNGDTWCPGGLEALVEGWTGDVIRILVPGGGPFGGRSPVAGALIPWDVVRRLPATPAGLWEVSWREACEEGSLEAVAHVGPFLDCATPADYLAANLVASSGRSVVGAGAVVEGEISESVIWPGGRVHAAESLWRAIRLPTHRTVLVRGPLPDPLRYVGTGPTDRAAGR